MSACITSVCSNQLSGGHITTPLVSYRYSGQQIKHNGIFGLNHSTGDSNHMKILYIDSLGIWKFKDLHKHIFVQKL